MYMKKWVHLLRCLTLLLVIVLLPGSATAAPERIFSDVPDNHWAERYITRMNLMGIIEGYSDGSYGINQPVSRFEIVTTIIRVMGLESQSEGLSIPDSFKYPASVPEWAKKYIAMGVIQEVITGDDLVSFRGGEPAKRYEVAEFIGKAMGYAGTADQHALDDLPYVDEENIPLEARGYISLLKSDGVMEGNENGRFRPLDNVTRGEMAALMAKMDEKLGKFPDKEIKGTVSQVTQSTVTIKTDDGYETLIVDENSYIFLKEGKGVLEDIIPLDWVLAVKNGFKAQLLEVSNSGSGGSGQDLSGTVSGEVVTINYHPELEIIIFNTNKETQTIPISDDCIIEREGEEVLVKDILPGDKIEIVLEEGLAEEILADPTSGNLEGKIKQIVIRDKALLTIVDADDEEYTYEIKDDTKIRRNGDTVSPLELKAGDYVDLQWESNFATKVYAESRYMKEQLTGKVLKVNSDLNMLVITPDEEDEDLDEIIVVFAPENTKIVTIDGAVSSRLNKIKTGDRIVIVGDLDNQVVLAQTIIILGAAE
ncbi:MAG: S-layer homology domain-containing protein [Dehalobacterium sp.]